MTQAQVLTAGSGASEPVVQGMVVQEMLAPVPSAGRLQGLDVLRGVAVLGILVMNIYAFAMPFIAYGNPLVMGGTESYNLGTWFVTHLIFDQKFMSIFSLLFGAGIVLMMNRADAKNTAFGPLFFRRQFWLAVTGLLHAYLLWFGDILFFYAVTGMLVFLFRRQSARVLVISGTAFLLIGQLLALGGGRLTAELRAEAEDLLEQQAEGAVLDDEQQDMVDSWMDMRQTMSPTQAEIDENVDAYRGRYVGILRFRAPDVAMLQLQALPFFILWRVGGLMLFGMAMMKRGVLTGRSDPALYRRMMLVGYGAGLPLALFSAVNAYAHEFDSVYMFGPGGVPNYLGSILVALGHIGLVLWLVRTGAAPGVLARCAAVGRMALSNYLVQSLVMTTIFYGYGFGLYAAVPRFGQMVFVAGLIGLQLLASPWWLARYRFGPAEWAWRSLTYGRRQPMRRSP